MIFVTLGTQDKSFIRLLKDIQELIDNGLIKDKVIVQAGYTKFTSKEMEIYDLLDKDEFDKIMNKCDLLITHGGVGSILTGLKYGKKVIAYPRLAKYNEHVNDHQLQIVDKFSQAGYILACFEEDNLGDIIKKSIKFKPNTFKSNTDKMVDMIENFIDNN